MNAFKLIGRASNGLKLERNCLLRRLPTNYYNSRALLTSDVNHYKSENNNNTNYRFKSAASILAFTGLIGFGYYQWKNEANRVHCEEKKEDEEADANAGLFIAGLPSYTKEEVAKHGKGSPQIWCSYKQGVYDITEFIESHPGGKIIYRGAGKPLEPFWETYAVHKKKDVFEILEAYRIGNLIIDEKDKKKSETTKEKSTKSDPFANEPKRHPSLTVLTQKPFNAETPKQQSAANLVTPNELFFVRNHLPVPQVDVEKFRLEIVNEDGRSVPLSLHELKSLKLPEYTIPVTIQCSGNKRKFMHEFAPVQGLMWDVNGISTAQWTGVKLRDLLKHLGVNLEDERIKHVQFEGLDVDPTGTPYATSVPKEKVLNEFGDVLLAYKMNGQDIPPDHGFPLRVIVPGIIGARSVKWLNKIILSEHESTSHWQINDYKILSPTIKDLKQANFKSIRASQEANIQSGICEPVEGSIIKRANSSGGKGSHTVKVKGYAYSGGGNDIDRVVVSIDGGKNWQEAKLIKFDNLSLYRVWAWTLWELDVPLPKDKENIEIVCVATDSSGNTQPETVKSIWNARGLMNNAWHKINVKLA